MKRKRKMVGGMCLLLVTFFCYDSQISVVEAVSDNEITVSDNGMVKEDAADADVIESTESLEPDLQVEFPTDISFILDPFEIGGKGQVYSASFDIINKSNVDVEVEISHIKYVFANDSDFKASPTPIDTSIITETKDIYLFLKWAEEIAYGENGFVRAFFGTSHVGGEADVVITGEEGLIPQTFRLEASKYDELGQLMNNPNSRISFCLDGSINSNASIPWTQGDVKLELVYKCRALENTEEALNSVSGNEIMQDSVSDNSISGNSVSENEIPTVPQPEDSKPPTGTTEEPEQNTTETLEPQTTEASTQHTENSTTPNSK